CFCHCFAQLERDSKKSTFINVLDRASTASFGAASLRFPENSAFITVLDRAFRSFLAPLPRANRLKSPKRFFKNSTLLYFSLPYFIAPYAGPGAVGWELATPGGAVPCARLP